MPSLEKSLRPPDWDVISRIAGVRDTRIKYEELEKEIKKAFSGGKLDTDVNPDAVKDLVKIIMTLGKSVNFHNWQKEKIVTILEEYIK